MSKPDLFLVQPIHLDYPGFRKQLRKYRDNFAKVVIAWSNHNVLQEYSCWMVDWVQEAMKDDDVEFVPYQEVEKEASQDWGQRLYLAGMKRITSDRLLITQQDFVVRNKKFFDVILNTSSDLVTHFGRSSTSCNLTQRCEPDFILVNMDLWRSTSMDISADPTNGYDHFGKISIELFNASSSLATLEDLGFKSPKDWEHLGGLATNYYQIMIGQENWHSSKENFIKYNKSLLRQKWTDVPMHPKVLKILEKAANIAKH